MTILQVTSAYSLLKSTIRIKDYIADGLKKGYRQLALTDEGVLHGAIEFYEACQKANIKPIIGCQFTYHPWQREEHQATLIVYCTDEIGYRTVIALSSYYQEDKTLSKRMKQLIREAGAHVQLVFAQGKSEWASCQTNESFESWVDQVKMEFGEVPIGLGIESANELLISIETLDSWVGQRFYLLPYMKAYYLRSDDHFSWSVLAAIREGSVVDIAQSSLSGVHYLHDAQQVTERFSKILDGRLLSDLDNFTKSLDVKLTLHQRLLPKFLTPYGVTSDCYLRQLCERQLQEWQLDERYQDRLDYELRVIHQMGFDDYFLIVWDIMRYAHEEGIQTGPGRGSAAGSLVAYLLKITQVDPIQYDLLFERFLNPERHTMPDIDLDFPDNRRDRLLHYVAKKYGTDHVAQILTFGTMGAKQAIRDVCRVMGRTLLQANQWAKTIPNQIGIKLDDAYRQSATLRDLIEQSKLNLLIFDTARKIEGLPRHQSTHAAGVIMSDHPLINEVPLLYRDDVMPTTQYTMTYVERIGLLKMDFLGLTNLAILHDALENTKKVYQVEIDVTHLPLDDEKTLEIFQQARTNGIFQFESDGIRRVLKKLQPTSLEDITAVNALYRPGPMEQIDSFVKRKHGREAITYLHPVLEEVLQSTYGIMVYQEQVMQVANRMAGYTLGEADILRRAMGKKDAVIIDRERQHFIDGATNKGIDLAIASQVYDYIERFANYGFNKSHALAYSLLAYQLAFFKAHYPIAFYTGIFNAVGERSVKLQNHFSEAKSLGIRIHAPNINTSVGAYSAEKEGIYIGLNGIKGLRRDFVQAIITNRHEQGPFKDFMDFAYRLGSRFAKEEALTALIDAGAFDHFGKTRATLRATVNAVVESVKFHQGMTPLILIDDMYPKYFEKTEDDVMLLVERELEVLGFPMSAFPSEKYELLYQKNKAHQIGEIYEPQLLTVIGVLKEIRRIQTKKGLPMATAKLQDATGTIELVIFPNVYPRVLKQLTNHTLLGVRGRVMKNLTDGWQIEVQQFYTQAQLDKQMNQASIKIYLKIPQELETREIFRQIAKIVHYYPGDSDLFWYLESKSKLVRANFKSGISVSEEAMTALIKLLGPKNVKKIK